VSRKVYIVGSKGFKGSMRDSTISRMGSAMGRRSSEASRRGFKVKTKVSAVSCNFLWLILALMA